jgi:tyrosyl-tRNA synthetase
MRDVAEQLQILSRGVDKVVPEPEFLEKLKTSVREGKPLRVKYGIDPTGISVHLGHTVPLRKLRQFQDLGHQAVIIIGNYTALVGDPSGRDETRAKLTPVQVAANAKDYLQQVGKIIDLDRAEVHHNGDWFSKWSFLDVLDLTRQMTLGQISAREDFAQRIAAEKPVYLHECLYPLMQGWDSVEIRSDVELGGTEQLFSLLVARDLQTSRGQRPQVALTMPILVGTDGVRRMGKSLGNYIGVADDPNDMFGKIMSTPDSSLRQYFMLLTDLPLTEVDHWLCESVNPRDAKEALGKSIVSQYWGSEKAEHAAEQFRRRGKGEDPTEIRTVAIPADALDADGRVPLPKLLVLLGFESGTSAGRRTIEQGGVKIGPERETIKDPKSLVTIGDGLIVRVGPVKIARAVGAGSGDTSSKD